MIKGKLINILPIEVGTSKAGKEFKKRNFVIDTGSQYNPLVCFQLFGDKCDIIDAYKLGQEIEVSYNLSSREFGGKWYHNLDAWKVQPVGSEQPVVEQSNINDEIDELPF